MKPTDVPPSTLIDSNLPLAGVDVKGIDRSTVIAHLLTAQKMAETVFNTPLEQDTLHLGGVFCPAEVENS